MLRRSSTTVLLAALALVTALPAAGRAERATVREYKKVFRTYPFSDPDPVPNPGRIYPYFRFDGFTDRPVDQEWTVVELENRWIRVTVMPEIGGKVWTAVEKTTGKPFLYGNSVVKFRDIAMRGPWTSGGIEANYGIIGHTPNCATPVDYVLRENPDGSASVVIGALDLLTRTPWRLEVKVPAGQGVLHDHLPLAQPDAARAALLHVDERRLQGRGQPPVRLPGHPRDRPRRRGGPLADRREGPRPVPLREKRLRRPEVLPRARSRVRLLGCLLARRRLRHGPLLPARREARQEDLDLGPLPAGDDLGEAPHRHGRAVRRASVRAVLQPGRRGEHADAVQAPGLRALRHRHLDRALVPRGGHEGPRGRLPARGAQRGGRGRAASTSPSPRSRR